MGDTAQLTLLDLATHAVTNLCITTHWGDLLSWSPDSHFIAVGVGDKTVHYQTILVDVQNEWAAKVNDNGFPVGWLKEP